MKFCKYLILFLVLTVSVEAQEWSSLKLLESTKKDVIKLFGLPSSTSSEKTAFLYNNKENKIYFDFASGKCTNSDSLEWNVPKDTLVRMIIQPQVKRLITEVKFDLKDFIKSKPSKQYRITYSSSDNSILIETYFDGLNAEEILSITYLPSQEKYNLKCKK